MSAARTESHEAMRWDAAAPWGVHTPGAQFRLRCFQPTSAMCRLASPSRSACQRLHAFPTPQGGADQHLQVAHTVVVSRKSSLWLNCMPLVSEEPPQRGQNAIVNYPQTESIALTLCPRLLVCVGSGLQSCQGSHGSESLHAVLSCM
uniref:Uncharacterized protein n=1 Tax=Eutreptiella gymnastica TaxID=73025 RepID=A0A7S4D3H8_9EUGL